MTPERIEWLRQELQRLKSQGRDRAIWGNRAIEELLDEVDRLRKALEPFAEVADWIERNGHDPDDLDTLLRGKEGRILGHFQVQPIDCMGVRAALSPSGEASKQPADALADLVARFSAALLEKLRAAEQKYGYSDAWQKTDWADDLRRDLLRHVQKGDPRDVAAYCAFAWHHGWSLSSPVQGVPEGWVLVPREPTVAMQNAAVDVDSFKLGDISPLGFRISPQMLFSKAWAAMLAAAPKPPAAPLDSGRPAEGRE